MVSTTNTSLVVSADEVFDEMTMNKFLKRECKVDEYYAYYTSTVSNKNWSEWYITGLFVFGLQSEIGKRVEMYNPKSLLDAYHLAKWQESLNDIMRKNSSTSLSSSSKIDHSKEVKKDNIELEFSDDGKGNESQSSGEEINKFGVKVLEVPCEEHVEGIGMKSKGLVELDGKNMEMDGKIGIKSRELVELDDKNMDKVGLDSSKDADTGEAFSNDIKIDSKGWVDCDSSLDEVCEEARKSSELESNVSYKVDVDGIVDCEEDQEDHEVESSEVVDDNIDLKNFVEVSKKGNKDEEMSSKDLSGVEDNNTCFVEMTTEVTNIRVSVTNVQYDKAYRLLEYQDNKEDDGVKCNEEVRNLVNGVPGMEIDLGRNGDSNSDDMEVNDVALNLVKEDAKCDSHKEVENRKKYDGEQEDNKKRRSLSILVSIGEIHVEKKNEDDEVIGSNSEEEVDKSNGVAILDQSNKANGNIEERGLEQKGSNEETGNFVVCESLFKKNKTRPWWLNKQKGNMINFQTESGLELELIKLKTCRRVVYMQKGVYLLMKDHGRRYFEGLHGDKISGIVPPNVSDINTSLKGILGGDVKLYLRKAIHNCCKLKSKRWKLDIWKWCKRKKIVGTKNILVASDIALGKDNICLWGDEPNDPSDVTSGSVTTLKREDFLGHGDSKECVNVVKMHLTKRNMTNVLTNQPIKLVSTLQAPATTHSEKETKGFAPMVSQVKIGLQVLRREGTNNLEFFVQGDEIERKMSGFGDKSLFLQLKLTIKKEAGVRHLNFGIRKWPNRKRTSGTKCILNHSKLNFDIWKWPKRKKEGTESSVELMFCWNEDVYIMFIEWLDYSKQAINKHNWNKNMPKREKLVRQRHQHNFPAKFYGPYQVIVKVGKVAYKLELLEDAKIVTDIGTFPVCNDGGLISVGPPDVLDGMMQKRGNAATVYVLVQWANGTVDEATWEWIEDLQRRFPLVLNRCLRTIIFLSRMD
ncbi:hypothetical protein Tco_1116278 [Tanacetum coccineum]